MPVTNGVYTYPFVPGSTNKPLFDAYYTDQGVITGWTAKFQARTDPSEDPVLDVTGVITRIAPNTIDAATLALLSPSLQAASFVWHILFAAPASALTQDLTGVYKIGVGLHGPSSQNIPLISSGLYRFVEDVEHS